MVQLSTPPVAVDPSATRPAAQDELVQPLVSLQDVELSLGGHTILDGIDLRVDPQERLVVMGQSGAGKSTLLRLILGILQPSAGTVKFRGSEVNKLSRRELNAMRAKIGMVYQYSALISSLSVRDNLALPMEELTDKSEKEIERTVDEKLAMVQMAHVKDKMPAELSGGMRKRIGLARALVLEPELILFDEPSAGLDPVTSSVIDELIIALSTQTKATSVIVTHEMDSAFRVATRMVMLYQGKLIADGTPEEFKHSDNGVVAQFVAGRTEGPIVDSTKEVDALECKKVGRQKGGHANA
jgi:phospholipid/cholesterol/gamma-HCH transport system ATP-binding protein